MFLSRFVADFFLKISFNRGILLFCKGCGNANVSGNSNVSMSVNEEEAKSCRSQGSSS